MKMKVFLFAALATASAALASTAALAQVLDLSGQFRCVQGCAGGLVGAPAYIAQNGWNMRLVNEAGVPARAWIDRPGHIWVQYVDVGAIYSADGMTIQFDNGTVWQRDLGQFGAVAPGPGAPPAPGRAPAVPTRRSAAPIQPVPVTAHAYDGDWSVQIITQQGSCDRAYRFAAHIVNGYVENEYGGAVNLQGRVAPNGAIRVSVSSGGQEASGSGHLSGATGGGTWSGQGSVGSCAGVWEATRRG
jgi:hypothetical protein